MCNYDAFYYCQCKKRHIKFVRLKQCWTDMLSLDQLNPRMLCTERIVNGDPEGKVSGKFPRTEDICPQCCPVEAAAQEEERKKNKKA